MYVTAQMNFICSGAGLPDAHVQFSCTQERSGRASEHGIQRSEVPFFMETEDFFLCPMIVPRQNIFLYLFIKVKNYLSSILKSTEDATKSNHPSSTHVTK